VTARSYLSIGDVLTLLRQEFPDVTISKIRFLESQGLVNPERTPSGYRKFYEHDVERLRWVLRQQREHFLPLKVIKDRLDDDPGGSAAATAPSSAVAKPTSPASASSGDNQRAARPDENHAEEPVLVGHRASSESALGAVDSRPGGDVPPKKVGDGPTLPGIESALSSVPAPAGSKPSAASTGSSPNMSHAATVGTSTAHRVHTSDRSAVSGMADDGTAARPSSKPDPRPSVSASSAGPPPRRSRGAQGGPSEPAVPTAADVPAAPDQPASEASAPSTPSKGATLSSPRASSTPVDLDGASLSVEELSAACGLDVTVLLELQEYGLLTSMTVAGLEYFDEDALAVATVAAQFARFGIEPRHLRLYKNAAEREAGFVEQIVLPLVRQRNPDARARAHETADELALLGQQLRSALLRRALGDLLNG
jgi:DNA-binding transcriptional MerR regulator